MSGKNALIVDLVIENKRLNDEVLKWIADYNKLELRAYELQDQVEELKEEVRGLHIRLGSGEAITFEPEDFWVGPIDKPDEAVAKLAEANELRDAEEPDFTNMVVEDEAIGPVPVKEVK